MDAWTFVLLNYASPTEENPMPTLSHPLSGQKMLSKLYSSWVPGCVPFQRYFTLIYTPLADSHILWTISKPRGVRGMTGEKKKNWLKCYLQGDLSDRKSVSTPPNSRDIRGLGPGVNHLVALTKWPRNRVTRGGGSGQQDAWEPNLVPVGVCEESRPSRLVPEAGIVLRCVGDCQRGLLSTTGSLRRDGSKRTWRRSHRDNWANALLQSGVRKRDVTGERMLVDLVRLGLRGVRCDTPWAFGSTPWFGIRTSFIPWGKFRLLSSTPLSAWEAPFPPPRHHCFPPRLAQSRDGKKTAFGFQERGASLTILKPAKWGKERMGQALNRSCNKNLEENEFRNELTYAKVHDSFSKKGALL